MEINKNRIKVGIPKALHYYRYFPFWKKLLEELGVDIILSQPTNKMIIEEGSAMGFGELCLPVKVYYGHTLKMLSENLDLDFLFVPRYVSEEKDAYFCPKFLSLPDVISILPNIPKILNFEVNIKEFPIFLSAIALGKQLRVGKLRSLKAYLSAKKYFKEYHNFLRDGAPVEYALKLCARGRPFKLSKKKVQVKFVYYY